MQQGLDVLPRWRVGLRYFAGCFRQAPIDNNCFTVFAEHDVAGLDIAVQDAAVVGIMQGVADVDQTANELVQLDGARALNPAPYGAQLALVKFLDRVHQAVAADEAHRVERSAVRVSSQAVNRHNSWMLQAAGNFRFQKETRSAV